MSFPPHRRPALVLGSLALAGLLALAGCSSTAGAAKPPSAKADKANKTIGVSISDQTSLFYIAAVDGMREEAAKKGYKLIVQQAGDDGTTQVNQVQNLITQKPGAVIYTPTNATAANTGAKALNAAGIPIIGVDQKPTADSGTKLTTYIATDSVKAARDLALWLFKQIGNSGEIGVLTGIQGSTAQLERSKGLDEALKATKGVKVVGSQTADWDETKAFNKAQSLISANPKMKAIFAESDAMALGAAKAAKQANRSLKIVGIDGFPTMFTAIKAGLTDATQAQHPYQMGKIAVDNAVQAITGSGSIPPLQYQPTTLITKDNVNQRKPTEFYGPKLSSK